MACGEDESPFTVTGVTKPRYVAQGDEICRDAERKLRATARDVAREVRGQEPGGEAITRVTEESVIPVVEERIADLRALTPPPGDEQEVDRIYDAADEALHRIEADPELAERADKVFAEAARLASAYGFQDCAGV